jgi:isopenicillin N synthase-like dioxygenase
MHVPIIDVAALRNDPEGSIAGECITAIDAACVESGFFVITGHGVDEPLQAVFAAAHAFFAEPLDVKMHVAMVGNDGFVPIGTAPLDPAMGPETKERLDLGLGASTRWPTLQGFRDAVLDYQRAALALADDLLRALAVALDIGSSFFAHRMQSPQCFLRMMHYPPVPLGTASTPLAAGPHTDYGAITLLATDGVPGLEVRPIGGDWTPVVAPPGSFIINLGDMLARWTNQRYVSTVHRVVAQPAQHRYSVPFFINPDPDTEVACLPSCVSTERPCRYEPISAGRFLQARIDGTILTDA